MTKRYAVLTSIALALLAAGAAQAQSVVASPNPLNVSAQAGGAAFTATINFASSDNTTVLAFYLVPGNTWITVPQAPTGGFKTPTQVQVTINPQDSSIHSGTNAGSINLFNSQFQTGSMAVNLTISSISVSPSSVSLGSYQVGSSIFPGSQTLAVSGANGNFTLSKAPADNWYTAQAFGSPLSGVVVAFNQAAASSLTPSSTPLQGTLTITPGGTGAIPVTVPITLTVTASPQVTVAPTTPLVFNWQLQGTNNQKTQTFTLTTNSATAVAITGISSSPVVSWVTFPSLPSSIPAGGSTTVTVQVNGDSQGAGTLNTAVQVTIAGALFPNGTTTANVPVQLNVSNFPVLYASPAALSFAYTFLSPNTPSPQNVTPVSSGGSNQPLQYNVSIPGTVPWLSFTPAGTLTTPSTFQVSVPGATTLGPGTYTGNVVLTPVNNGSGQTPITIPVTLTITFGTILQVNTSQLIFPYETGQAAPPQQTVALSTSTGAPLNYSVIPPSASTAPWVQVSGNLSGVTDQTSFAVAINPAGIPSPLPGNPLDATIVVGATDPTTSAAVNQIAIDVKLWVSPSGTPQLVVVPPGPLVFTAYPNSPTYPLSATSTLSLSSTSSLPGEALTIGTPAKTVTNQSVTGNWLGGTNPVPLTPTSFTVNGTVLGNMPPGTYNGNVQIPATSTIASTVPNSPVNIPVTFVVNDCKITSPQTGFTLSFNQNKGGTQPAAQTVNVNTDGLPHAFFATVNTGLSTWLKLSTSAGTTPGSFNVSADATNLTTGVYNGAIYVTVPNAAGSPFRIPVQFTVGGGSLTASAQSLSFTQVLGGATPAAQTVQVTSSPSGVAYTATVAVTTPAGGTWLAANVTAGGGSTPGTVTVSVTPGSLGAGPYTGSVTITSAGTTPIVIPVTLTVTQATITASTTPLTFNQFAGGAAPAAQTVNVTSTPATIGFSVGATTSNGVAWLTATAGTSGTSGNTPGTVQVSVNSGSLAPGPYTGLVTITSQGANGSPIAIPILLNVQTASVLTASQSTLTFNAVVGQATTPQTFTLNSPNATPFTIAAATKDGANWLAAAPTSGTTGSSPITVTVTASTQSLAPGNYSGTVTISSPNTITPIVVNVSLTVQAIPTPVISSVKNAASYAAGAVSPGENIVIFGTGIGPTTLLGAALNANGQLSTNVGNTQVFFDGTPAPIVYVSATQTSVMVPYEIGGRSTTNITVVYSQVSSQPLSYNVTASVPGIYTQNFSGSGPGVILNSDNVTLNGPNAPAAKGSIVVVYMTGEGATNPASTTGSVAATSGNPLNKPILPVTATVGGQTAQVVYYGSAPGIVYGVMQVNIMIPASAATGAQPIVINVGNNATLSGVTVSVQ